MANQLEYAKHELDLIGLKEDSGDEMNVAMRHDILQIVETFSDQGHSGFSASYALAILKKVLNFQPLTDLTGEDDEWIEVADDLYQNKRAFDVFKDANGAYWSQGIVFWEWFTPWDNGVAGEPYKTYFTSYDSRVPITFPFSMPSEPEYREADPNR
jgi:hypothetical protein